jgi:hypothetical protein
LRRKQNCRRQQGALRRVLRERRHEDVEAMLLTQARGAFRGPSIFS